MNREKNRKINSIIIIVEAIRVKSSLIGSFVL